MARSIAVAGKGGTGKSTIAALIIVRLQKRGAGPILAVDADPDSSLGHLLGIEFEQTVGDLREDVLRKLSSLPAGMPKAAYVEAGLHQIIEETDGVDLLTMGRGEGSGCYCSLNNMIRKFTSDLNPTYPWVVMDNEAGLEHIARRTSAMVDALIVVVGDNPLSFNSARRILEITRDLDKRFMRRYLVTNMVKEERRAIIMERITELDFEHICDIPFDPNLEETVFSNKPLSTLCDSPVLEAIDIIVEKIGGGSGHS